MTQARTGWKLLIGGSAPEGLDPRLVRRFVDLAEGLRPPARRRALGERGGAGDRRQYTKSFAREDVQHLDILDVRAHEDADAPDTLSRLGQATAVMFTGGDQLRLLDLLWGASSSPPCGGASAKACWSGGPARAPWRSATRRSCAANPRSSSRPEPSAARLASASSRASVDTHFVVRGRLPPGDAGLGVPGHDGPRHRGRLGREISPDGVVTVIGHGVVCVVDGPAAPGARRGRRRPRPHLLGLTLHVLADGEPTTCGRGGPARLSRWAWSARRE